MIGHARPLLVWWVREGRGQFRDDWNCRAGRRCGIAGRDGLVSLCVQEDEADIQQRTGAPSGSFTAGAARLLRGQALEDQGILGRNEIAERHLV